MTPVYGLKPKKYDCIVLLSTFNGEKYLREQLDSLASQSFRSFQVLVRDDGSTDSTLEILNTYKETFEMVILDNCSHFGLFLSYSLLLKHARLFKYIALCDQDDIWSNDKLQKQISVLKSTDCLLSVCNYSKFRQVRNHTRISRSELSLVQKTYLMIRNTLPGNCFVFKSNLLSDYNFDLDVPHDWQISMIASNRGGIHRLGETLIFYRQHENNAIGTSPWIGKPRKIVQKVKLVDNWRRQLVESIMKVQVPQGPPRATLFYINCIVKDNDLNPRVKFYLLYRIITEQAVLRCNN
jgi:rhamnosyltransferase